jgi:hypothetical protein
MLRTAVTTVLLVAAALLTGCGSDDSEEPSGSFAPRATLDVVGGSVRTDKPDFVMRVTPAPGDENIRDAAVELPTAVLADVVAIPRLCTESELETEECEGRTPLGFARVDSPAYEGGLRGPVYAVTGSGRLPRLAYLLSGPRADVILRGPVVSKRGRIQAGVENVPDTRIDQFELRISGGESGFLVLSRNICRRKALADATFTSQGGQEHAEQIPLRADCGS